MTDEPEFRLEVSRDWRLRPPAVRRPVARTVRASLKRPVNLAVVGSGLRIVGGRSIRLTGWAPDPTAPGDSSVGGAGGPAGAIGGPAELSLFQRLLRLLQPPAPLLLAPDGPIEWPAPLFAYQVAGVATLLERGSLLLADDMGLGKTIQAIAALRIALHRQEAATALLLVPAGLIDQWRGQLRRWAPELWVSVVRGTAAERAWQWAAPAHLYLVSYESFRSDAAVGGPASPRDRAWDIVILDEAQRIKNRETEVSRQVKRLRRQHGWALTGTPLENAPDELVSILEFVGQSGADPADGPPPRDLPAQQARFQLRRRKAEVLADLPPKLIAEVSLPLTGAQRESYDRAERDGLRYLRELGSDVQIRHVLELIVRLKQICNFCPATGQSAKLEDLRSRLETLADEGHRALVFSQFTDERHGVAALARHLQPFGAIAYTGALTAAERTARLTEFRTRPDRRVLILSLRAGGQGLNLADASYVFHFDRWWNPAVERQAEDRSHRLGQTLPVHVYRYTCLGTIEERIGAVLREKQRLFDALVDQVSIEAAPRLTAADFFGLFNLAPSAPTGADLV